MMQGGPAGPDTQPTAPRFSSAAIGTFGNQLATAFLSFLNVLLVARTVGPSGRGEIAFLTTVTALSSVLALLGIDEANVNFAGKYPHLRRSLATNSLLLSSILGLLSAATVASLMAIFPALGGQATPWLRWLALATIPILIFKISLKFLLQADYHFKIANASWLIQALISVAVSAVLAVVGHLTVETAFVTWAVSNVLAMLLLVVYVSRRSVGFGRPDASLARRTLNFGYKSHLGRIMLIGNYRLDQWFVGAISGPHQLGLYSIAVTLAEILFYLPTALVIAQRPYLVRASRKNAGRRAAQVFRFSAVATLVSAIGVIILAPVLCVTIFGDEFRGSVDDLRMLAPGALGVLALKLFGNAMTAQGRPTRATMGAVVAFFVMVLLDVVLVPPLGGLGAATASTVAYLVGGIATGMMFLRFFDVGGKALIPRVAELPGVARAAWDPLPKPWRSRTEHRWRPWRR